MTILANEFEAHVLRHLLARRGAKLLPVVGKALGMHIVADPDCPRDEIRFAQDGKVVGRIVGLPEASNAD